MWVGVWSVQVPQFTTCHNLKPVSSRTREQLSNPHALQPWHAVRCVGSKLDQYGRARNADPSTNDPPSDLEVFSRQRVSLSELIAGVYAQPTDHFGIEELITM